MSEPTSVVIGEVEFKRPNGGAMGIYVKGKLQRPTSCVEEQLVIKIEALRAENEGLKRENNRLQAELCPKKEKP